MDFVIEFFFFLLAIPALLIFAFGGAVKAVVDYLGGWFAPALVGIYVGFVLLVMGQPSPDSPYETITQELASVTLLGVTLPLILIGFGISSVFVGVLSRFLKKR